VAILGAKFDPRGEVGPGVKLCPLEVKLSPGVKTLCSPPYSFEEKSVFTPGPSSPLGRTNILRVLVIIHFTNSTNLFSKILNFQLIILHMCRCLLATVGGLKNYKFEYSARFTT
jgi:hypothetical protein